MSAMMMPGRPDKSWSSQSTWKLAGSPFGSGLAKKVEMTNQEKDNEEIDIADAADEDNNGVETSDNGDIPEAHNDDDSSNDDEISEPESSNKDKNETTDEEGSISSTESSSSGSSSSSSSSDVTIKPKKRRLVSPTTYTPAFPNLPSGRAWFARQAARGNPVAQPTIPKGKRVSVSTARRKRKATPARKPHKEPAEPVRRSKRQKLEAGPATSVNQQIDIAGSGRGHIKRATKTSSATASSTSEVDESTSDQASLSPFEEDFSTTQPWMLPHDVRYEMDQRRPIDTSKAFVGPFNTTPIVPLVTPYNPPKKGPLLMKDEDGRMVDLGMYTGPIHRLAQDENGKLYVVDGKKQENAKDMEAGKEDQADFVKEENVENEKEDGREDTRDGEMEKCGDGGRAEGARALR
ncbi:hypothetical protein G7Y79_00003g011930 [Physcia stellaris]|nr:hypothetical protein G7Y79_00003g011930 [Physcia stellaris]